MKLFTRDDSFMYYCILLLFFAIVFLEMVVLFKESGGFDRARVKLRCSRQTQSRVQRTKRGRDDLILDDDKRLFEDKEEW
jgi:hypothetical protein